MCCITILYCVLQSAKYLSQNAKSHEPSKILTFEIFRLYGNFAWPDFFGMGHRKEPGVVVLQLSSIASELTDDGKCLTIDNKVLCVAQDEHNRFTTSTDNSF